MLSDASGYKDWHPVFVNVEGRFEQGGTVKTTVREPGKDDVVITSDVVKVEPGKEINQFGGLRGFITFDHHWLLEPVGGGTRVIQNEVDRGFYVWFWASDWVEPAYAQANEALRKRVLETFEN
ncbi:hypothetical protein AIOL_002072 [Candidatus Rhodobacter oscarellae]|uniref:Uncharacterized protein n=1 Tax=Candidatus Rhodobacter oscarellae TaxID=1675527 RepID=A0A0J9GU86_9RHOB|nr:hypothetical protein AIOL_002072 [Candidatus Rhodobacter lobularis]